MVNILLITLFLNCWSRKFCFFFDRICI